MQKERSLGAAYLASKRMSDSEKGFVRLGVLAKETGWSPAHLRRLAHRGEIPGAQIKKGRKFKVRCGMELAAWVIKMKSDESKRARKAADARDKPTGNGYSAVKDSVLWAMRQTKELPSYTAERAQAILDDVNPLREFFACLEVIASGKK